MVADLYHVTCLMKAVTLGLGIALVARVRIRPVLIGLTAGGALLLLVGLLAVLFPILGVDYKWTVGAAVWAGQDPYAADRFAEHPFLNPPTALPLFALFAALPRDAGFLLWTVLNVLGCLALVGLARQVVLALDDAGSTDDRVKEVRGDLPLMTQVGLTAALLLSEASLLTLYLGQLTILVALALLLALYARGRGRPVWAGVCLAVATVKVGTMLPFLVLFHRRRDWLAWVALFLATLGLCAAGGPLWELPGRLASLRERIDELEAPGLVNDYSFEGARPVNLLGFDRALYCVGLRDRGVIRVAQYIILACLGLWVAWQVLPRKGLSPPAASSLVALYAVVFFYHRSYDAVILALPLAYSAGQARAATGAVRWLFATCAVAVLLVLYQDIAVLTSLYQWSLAWGVWGRVVQAVVLPYGTWLILSAMVCLVLGARKVQASAAGGDGAGPVRAEAAPQEGALQTPGSDAVGRALGPS